jgi:hypothetical protein
LLSLRQIEILQAVVNRIIPADQHVSGWDAGVGDYLFRQFERDLKWALPLYALALDAIDAEARADYRSPFARMIPALQDDLLARIENGKVITLWQIDPAAFFRLLCEHCAEGFYADPGNGGNRGGVSWKMIGFEVRG